MIALAGHAVPGAELLPVQAELGLRASGAPEAQIEAVLADQRSEIQLIADQDWDALEDRVHEQTLAALEALPEEQRAGMGDLEVAAEMQVAASMNALRGWLYTFVTEDPSDAWANVRSPVLAVFGRLDTQVDLDQNRAPLEAALAGNGDVTVEVLEDANHPLQVAATAGDAYAATPRRATPPCPSARPIRTVMVVDVTTLSGKHRLRELQQPDRLPHRDLHVVTAWMDHPVLRLVLSLDESSKGGGGLLAAGHNLCEQSLGIVVVISPRSPAERAAAGGVGRSNARQDSERSHDASQSRIGLVVDEARHLEELLGGRQPGAGIGRTTGLRTRAPSGAHRVACRESSKTDNPERTIASLAMALQMGASSRTMRATSSVPTSAMLA